MDNENFSSSENPKCFQKSEMFPKIQIRFRKSNAHAHILDWCAFALDGVKNVMDGLTNGQTKRFSEKDEKWFYTVAG